MQQNGERSLEQLSFIEYGVLYKALEQYQTEDKRLEPVKAELLRILLNRINSAGFILNDK